ncbi:carbohydrate ABC transporter permease [Litorilinea aerophila]|uniref:Carbohydrate ABC transporter permease n=1 Tax=Litorilinea aerophila TaxID=1204385 RepID=A0A540VGM8_9CHLR|nr:carbohydrate ABC transporter permease [Litorilinea aerophila]MCC9076302.1 carbohydrate ABC transporter permease [Litorilinea aerophila]GIV77997.1 MAG: sugar ABC transporter permease [Litorilinea sp.]GIV78003.1 MAG: sugar ABC transporter permease [Litorilinea sp.]
MASITVPKPRAQGRVASVQFRWIGKTLVYLFLILGCMATLVPFLWMVFNSLKTSSEIIRVPPTFFPEHPTLESFRTIFTDPKVPLARFYFNSTFVAVTNVAIQLFTSSLAGYVFAKYRFRGKNLLFGFILASMMIPFQVTIIPAYLLIVKLGLVDTLWGLIVPSAVNAFGIFLMKQFIEGLPGELLDAARIDGAGEFGIYWRIVLPQVGPALATLGVLNFMGVWNSYLWPLIVITTHERRTLPIMLTWYNSQHGTRYDLTMAASILVVLPIIVVYLLAQRWVVQGIALTGMK